MKNIEKAEFPLEQNMPVLKLGLVNCGNSIGELTLIEVASRLEE